MPPDLGDCEYRWWKPSPCEGLPFYKKHEGRTYCVLHYPGEEKAVKFDEALEKKLQANDFNFRWVWFPNGVNFRELVFSTPVNFISAIFNQVAYFNSTTFKAEADFSGAIFNSRAYFVSASFQRKANFSAVTFRSLADFATTVFNEKVDFNLAAFSESAEFDDAFFGDYVTFSGSGERAVFGDKSSLSLRFARIESPDHFSFHALTLRPRWFVNTDARKFEFVDVDWGWRNINAKSEVKRLKIERVIQVKEIWSDFSAHRLLAIACRNLAVNAEENHRYQEASNFRYMAMDAQRVERWRGFMPWRLSWWYWVASGYGERVWRAFVVLIGVWVVAAALYTQVGFVRWEPKVSSEQEAWEAKRDEVGQPLRWPRALTYSLGVMALQKPEPRPATDAAQAVVMLETILGPVQAALLALAIRRKFMR
jgi:hypothetical protein